MTFEEEDLRMEFADELVLMQCLRTMKLEAVYKYKQNAGKLLDKRVRLLQKARREEPGSQTSFLEDTLIGVLKSVKKEIGI